MRRNWTRRRLLVAVAGTAGLAGCDRLRRGGPGRETVTDDRPARDKAATLNELVDAAEQTAADVETWRQERIETVREYATDETLVDGSQLERQTALDTEFDDRPDDIYHLHVVNYDTAVILASTNPAKESEPLNTREAPWQNDSLEYGNDDVFVSTATEALGRSLLSMVTPIDTDGDRQLVLLAQMDLDEYGRSMTVPPIADGIKVVNGAGRIVTSSYEISALDRNDGDLFIYQGGEDAPVLQQGLAGEAGYEKHPEADVADDDTAVLPVAYAPVTTAEWVVIVHERAPDEWT